jgi:hypothetical protein
VALHGSDVEDGAAAALAQFRNTEMSEKVRAPDVDGHAAIPGFGVGFDGGAKGMDGGAVDYEIEAAVSCDSAGNQRLHLLGAAHVAELDVERECARFLLQLAVCFGIDAAGDDAATCRSQAQGDGLADAGGSGDDGYAILKLIHLRCCN